MLTTMRFDVARAGHHVQISEGRGPANRDRRARVVSLPSVWSVAQRGREQAFESMDLIID
ncbi:hypothetical protein BZL54_32855 [Burkholderia ubonensis subsp. mesacidophila]|uniref:Uncharacterized protein n=1 Tax=Burkholderia ubonensis subsp. mesacidophila TaxID=265293 RepID=A0A2A4EU44_9BURK|nr:hypothetical protein BZL54_32855 [Burkholderia ubonensis subsp. mesacidophila]